MFQKRKYDEKVRIWKKKRKKIKRYLHLHSRISFANSVVSSQRCFCNRKKNKRELIPRETSKLEFGEPRFHLSLSLSVKKKRKDHSRSEKFQRTPTGNQASSFKLLPPHLHTFSTQRNTGLRVLHGSVNLREHGSWGERDNEERGRDTILPVSRHRAL